MEQRLFALLDRAEIGFTTKQQCFDAITQNPTAGRRMAVLRELQCPSAQGYHFCKPMPADKIVQALSQLMAAAPARVTSLRADGAS